MKKIKLIGLLFLAIPFFSTCKKEKTEPSNPYGGNNGQYTIWVRSDLGLGDIQVSIDNVLVGSISHYHSSGVNCGKGDVNVKLPEGTHSYIATSGSGGSWSGTLDFEKGECKTLELTLGSSGPAGKPGNPRFNLEFTNPENVDLDLYVQTPNGEILYYGNPTGDDGQLDVDCKCNGCPNGPYENIYWVEGTAPRGTYKYWVKYYGKCGSGTNPTSNFKLRRLKNSTVQSEISGTLSSVGSSSSVYTFTY